MDKRNFIKTLGLGVVSLPLSRTFAMAAPSNNGLLLPPTIKRGDTVGIITPASPVVDEQAFVNAENNFSALGLNLKWGQHVRKKLGYLAGTDNERLSDLEGMFADPDVKAIVCLRGGSGAARLLDQLDYDLIAQNPKIFLGYSDITAFHQAIHLKTGLVTFHGAVANNIWSPMVLDQFESLFFGGGSPTYPAQPESIRTIVPGVAQGRLLGGNLTVLTGIAGSPYFPDFEDSILFLEDIGEEPYRIDRMFSQLALSGALKRISGFVFGQCSNCESKNPANSLPLEWILDDYIKPLGIPAFQGALIGHMDEQYILPVGARVAIDAEAGCIKVVEPLFAT